MYRQFRATRGMGYLEPCAQITDCAEGQRCCYLPAYDKCMTEADCQMVLAACAAGGTGPACQQRPSSLPSQQEASETYQEAPGSHYTPAPTRPGPSGGGVSAPTSTAATSDTTIFGLSPLVAGAVGVVGVLVLAKIIFG